MTRLPRSLAVVGAGVIGIEYASMFAALGVEVTVIDRRDRPLEFLDAEIVDELIHQMRKRNVSFRLGEAVETLDGERRAADARGAQARVGEAHRRGHGAVLGRAHRRDGDARRSRTPASRPMIAGASSSTPSSARPCRTSSRRAT